VADLGANRKRVAQLFRMLGSSDGERRAAFAALERTMRANNVTWSDIGNDIERDDGKYTEAEMQEFAQAARAEGIEAGIKIGMTRANSNGGNGGLTLPRPCDMAEFCHQRLGQLKDDKQRDFVSDIYVITQRGKDLSLGRLGYLASIYIQNGGRT
jgi:hypothetical protein